MKTTIACLWVAFLLCGFDAVSPRTITGTVRDAVDGSPVAGVKVTASGTGTFVTTNATGVYSIVVPDGARSLTFSSIGYVERKVIIGKASVIDVTLSPEVKELEEVVAEDSSAPSRKAAAPIRGKVSGVVTSSDMYYAVPAPEPGTEEYDGLEENIFHGVSDKPLSTFSIDVDAASYANVRRFLNNGQRPPSESVRIEEMINYFGYDYPEPSGKHPFEVITEVAPAPWNAKHQLVHIGLQGRRIPTNDLPPSNLVFLIDVSGSMNQPNKLPLVKRSFEILVDQLRPEDHVAIVVYAGAAGVVLEPTPGSEKGKILNALEQLQAGGSTAGAAGLRLAYSLAKEHFNAKGNNRVILASDGDFNVGESSNDAMEKLIESKRKEGVYLTVLGYGMGNLKDSKMEILADKGNGNYAYIDNFNEARKVLVNEFAGTLFTIATDVKLQVEFNPARVKAYRLIGYENRKLKDEDFNNDRKDAGDLGSGHSVTALYEIIPVGVNSDFYSVDDLKYQRVQPSTSPSRDLLTVKLRYKSPGENSSHLMEHVVTGMERSPVQASANFRWSAAVAAFGMLLKESPYVGEFSHDDVLSLAQGARGEDEAGYRSEFLNLVRTYGLFVGAESRRRQK